MLHIRIYERDQKILSVYDYALYASVCIPHPHGENIFFSWIYFFLYEVARCVLTRSAFLYWVSAIFPTIIQSCNLIVNLIQMFLIHMYIFIQFIVIIQKMEHNYAKLINIIIQYTTRRKDI